MDPRTDEVPLPHRSHQPVISRLPDPFWVLQGTTAKELACSVTEAPSRAWIVMLKLGHETFEETDEAKE